ncbi:hypothetical protein FB45DRAFT_1064075 [Roridomyces roridus]|uniref:Uncharacterized protein n=1 Tax=Roridomyces roridus TaxID=1738132 RepID=A0AAD7FEM6_9AGAR|nr:hypothetical protein FB45DRAFT_1064075 [Roridomyces roridus]
MESTMLLPVCYLHLEPSSVPSVADLDATARADDVDRHVNAAVATLCAPVQLIPELKPMATAPDFWPRIGTWLHFLHTYRVLFPNLPAFERIKLPWIIGFFIMFFRRHPETSTIICARSGMRAVIASAWGEMLYQECFDGKPDTKIWMQSGMFSILAEDIAARGNLEEILNGVGGGYDRLAALMIEHIRQIPGSCHDKTCFTRPTAVRCCGLGSALLKLVK